MTVKCFLATCDVVEIRPPSYSSDLALTDIFLYAKIKTVVKEEEFKTPSLPRIT